MTLRGPLADSARRLGPAIVSFPIVGAALLDPDTLAVVSRNVRPTRVALLDLVSGAARDVVEVPTGDGAWAITPDGEGGAWLGLFGARGRANLYRLTGAAELEVAAAIDAVHLWDLAVADDGTVYGVSDGPAGLFAFDPATWLARDLGVVETGPELARSVAVLGGTVVVGGRREGRALLRAVPGGGGPVREVLPPALADHAIVYALTTAGTTLALGTRGPGRRSPAVAVLDGLDRPADARIATIAGADVVDTLLLDDGALWATVRPTGAVVRLDPGATEAVEVAIPVPLAEQRAVVRRAGSLLGASGDGSTWTLTPDDDGDPQVVVRDLVAEWRVDGAPEIVQSLAAADGTVWAGGTFGIARRVGDGPLQRVAVPGEPKALAIVEGTAHLAMYPIAEVWVLPPEGAPTRFASLPPEENRPLSLHVTGDVLLVGTAADAGGGGGFHVLDLDDGAIRRSVRDPLGGEQAVHRVAALDGIAFLGGDHGSVLAVEVAVLESGGDVGAATAWRVDQPVPDGGAVSGLVVLDRDVHLLTARGWHLVLDAGSGAERHRERVGETGGGLVVVGGRVYGVDADRLLGLGAGGTPTDVLLAGLAPRHWAQPTLASDGDDLLVLHGTDVLRVRLPDDASS